MDKKLRISIDLDDKAFSSAVKRMQDQLAQIQSGPQLVRAQQQLSQKMQSLGLGPLPGTPSEQQAKQAQTKAKQESDKIFEETRRKMELIKRLQSDLNKEQASGLASEERRLKIKERLVELGQAEKRTTGQMAAIAESREYKMGGAPLKVGSGGDLMAVTKTVLSTLGIGVGLAAFTDMAKRTYSSYVSAPAQINLAAGSAAQSTTGYLNQQMLSGDVMYQTMLQGQMGKGRGLAESEYDKRLGTIASKYLSAAGDIASDMSNYLFGTNLDTGRFRSKFQATRAAEVGRNTLEQAQASLAQNNSMILAQGFFGQNFARNLGAERSLGLGTDAFQRMQMQVNNAGFLTGQATDLFGQIQSAGGSAAGPNAGRLAALGLGAQRGMNVTNIGNVLGRITGLYGAGNIGQTEETTKRILEESIKKGFDKSENTEIMRKFVESSADLVYQGEAKKAEDVERLTRDFSQLLSGAPSMKEFESTQAAYQKYQGLTSETQGRGGALGFAAFLHNKSFNKLSPLQIANLQSLPEQRITTTNSDIIAAAAQQGISPAQMVQEVLSAKKEQALATVGISKRDTEPLAKYLGGRSLESLSTNFQELKKLQKVNPEAFQAYQNITSRAGLVGTIGSDTEKMKLMESLFLGPAGLKEPGAAPTTAAERISTGVAGKREEEYITAQAAQEKQLVLNLKAFQDEIYPTATGIKQLTQAIIELGSAAKVLTDDERARGMLQATPLAPVQTKASISRTPSNGSKPRVGGP